MEQKRHLTFAAVSDDVLYALQAILNTDLYSKYDNGHSRLNNSACPVIDTLHTLIIHVLEDALERNQGIDVANYLYWNSYLDASAIWEVFEAFELLQDSEWGEFDRDIIRVIGPYASGYECDVCGREIMIYDKSLLPVESHLVKYSAGGSYTAVCLDCQGKAPYPNWGGYVYVLQSGDAFKIGKSIDVDRRVTQISPVMPYPVEVIHTIRTTDHTTLEKHLHSYFADKRLNGEWFRLTKQDVQLLKLMHDVEV